MLCLQAQTSGHANSLTIGETFSVGFVNVSPVESLLSSLHRGPVSAGVCNLDVGFSNQTKGQLVQMPAFCIPAYQPAPMGQTGGYTVKALPDAPVNALPGALGSANAREIEKLWTLYYSGAISDSTGDEAMLLQAAIWLVCSGPGFSITSPAPKWNGTKYNNWSEWLTAYEAGAANAAPANLLALTNWRDRDYAVCDPDGGTILSLLGLALCGLAAAGRKSNR